MDIKLEEVELFGAISMGVGIAIFFVALLWDYILGMEFMHCQVAYNKGYGTWQILVMGFSGLYSGWALAINRKWHDYISKIHKHGGR